MTYQMVVMGTSLGGLTALETILAALPEEFPIPIAVVQHRSVESSGTMLAVLRRHSELSIREPHDKEAVRAGTVYIAPPDYHMMLGSEGFALTTEAPVFHARPSIDVLFESAADVYRERTVCVVLTGASGDGARGAGRIKARGGLLIVQDSDTAECAVMPRAALQGATADHVVSLCEIGPLLINLSRAALPVPPTKCRFA